MKYSCYRRDFHFYTPQFSKTKCFRALSKTVIPFRWEFTLVSIW